MEKFFEICNIFHSENVSWTIAACIVCEKTLSKLTESILLQQYIFHLIKFHGKARKQPG